MKRRLFPSRWANPIPYCSWRTDNNPPRQIPLKVWCKENYYSESQARRFLRTRDLLGVTYKGRMYVMVNPDSDELRHLLR